MSFLVVSHLINKESDKGVNKVINYMNTNPHYLHKPIINKCPKPEQSIRTYYNIKTGNNYVDPSAFAEVVRSKYHSENLTFNNYDRKTLINNLLSGTNNYANDYVKFERAYLKEKGKPLIRNNTMLAGLYLGENNTPQQNVMHIPSIPAPNIDVDAIEPSLDQLKAMADKKGMDIADIMEQRRVTRSLKKASDAKEERQRIIDDLRGKPLTRQTVKKLEGILPAIKPTTAPAIKPTTAPDITTTGVQTEEKEELSLEEKINIDSLKEKISGLAGFQGEKIKFTGLRSSKDPSSYNEKIAILNAILDKKPPIEEFIVHCTKDASASSSKKPLIIASLERLREARLFFMV